METHQYHSESSIEEYHWWFRGRRKLLRTVLGDLRIKKDAYILDIGCSSGTNLRCYETTGHRNYQPFDKSPEAAAIIQKKGFNKAILGSATELPFEGNTFDFISATDVLEHIDNDEQAIQEVIRVLKPNCEAYFTVPCHEFLWGSQDIVSHHLRRYKRGELKKKLRVHGFCIHREFYFNSTLLIPILIVRAATHLLFKIKLLSKRQSENGITGNGLSNSILSHFFGWECIIAYILNSKLPGVSCGYVVRKPMSYQQKQ